MNDNGSGFTGSGGGYGGLTSPGENERLRIIAIDRGIILEALEVSLELIVKIEETRAFLRALLQIRPEKLAGDAARPRRRDEIGDYCSSTHGVRV